MDVMMRIKMEALLMVKVNNDLLIIEAVAVVTVIMVITVFMMMITRKRICHICESSLL